MIVGFTILLAGAGIGYAVSRSLGLPPIPFLLLVGFVLMATGLLPPADILGNVIVLGVSFLLFSAGVELDMHRVGPYRHTALRIGLLQFFALAAVGLLVALGVGFGLQTAVFLAFALAASSTLVVVRLLQQKGQMFEPFGRMVLGVLLLQDLLLIILAPILIGASEGLLGAAIGLGLTLLLIGLAFVLQRWVVPYVILKLALEGESLLLVTLSVLFGFIGLAVLFDLPIITGAFLAGFSLASFPVSGLVREQLTPLTDFFLSIFFIALGGLIVVPAVVTLLEALVFVVVVIVITVPMVTILAERHGFSARAAIESGLLLSQTSELSIVIGLLALAAGVMDSGAFSAIVLVTVITMIATPFLATRQMTERLVALHPLRVRDRPSEPPSDHLLLLGVGQAGIPLLETLYLAGYDVLVVDDDPGQIEWLREEGIPSIHGDGSDGEVLQVAGADRARAIISMMRPADNAAMLQKVDTAPVYVRVFTDHDAVTVERLGGTPIRYADVAADAFLEWFDSSDANLARPEASAVAGH